MIAPPFEANPIDPLCDPEWERSVASNPEATIFHSAAWAKVLHGTYGHRPHYLRFSQEGRLAALMPVMEVQSKFTGRRGVCLPFSDFCAPLCFGGNGAETAILARLFQLEQERKWNYVELRGGFASESRLRQGERFYAHALDMTKPAEELFERFHTSVRRAIRKAERSELLVTVSADRKSVRQYYKLHTRTRRRHGIPPQPLSFFLQIYENIIKAGMGFVVGAHLRSRPVAAAIFFRFGKNALYKFGASDERLQGYRGNNMVMWEAIKTLAQKGLATLHLGRTALEHSGLRRFKLSLGAKEEMLDYFCSDRPKAPTPGPASNAVMVSNMLFRRLPLTVNRLAGTVLYPHLD